MSRFRNLSHTVWHCQYHIVWTPKFRYKILEGEIGKHVEECIRSSCDYAKAEIVELNVQKDHVHLLVMLPPKESVSKFVGTLKGKSAIRVLNKFKKLKRFPYWGNHFWSRGYCVDTVGLDSEMIAKYVKFQDDRDKRNT